VEFHWAIAVAPAPELICDLASGTVSGAGGRYPSDECAFLRATPATLPMPPDYITGGPLLAGAGHQTPDLVAADMVVFAVGVRSDADLHRACVAQQSAEDIRSIGDCFRVGRIFDATKAAHATASAL
jgi:hypothetical protein